VTQPPQPGPWDGQQPGQWHQAPGYPGGPSQPGAPGPYSGPGQYGPPQQQWPNPVPPKKGGPAKWVLGAVALVAVIAVTAVIAVSCTKNGGNSSGGGNGSGGGTSAPNNSGIASANDTGPVGIITEDPSCAPWGPVATTLANVAANGWDKRDASIPANSWTPEQKSQYQAVEDALRGAADQTIALVKLTPHRVMRELYEQFIAYSRAYADRIETYTPSDDNLNRVSTSIVAVLNGVCGAITLSSAQSRAPLVSDGPVPNQIAPVGDVANPKRFMLTADAQCLNWRQTIDDFNHDPAYSQWSKEDSNLPASSWTDQYKQENQAVTPVLKRIADGYLELSRNSSSPFAADLGALGAQYARAFVISIPSYSVADSQLYSVFSKVPSVMFAACDSATG